MMPEKHVCSACGRTVAWQDRDGLKPARGVVLKERMEEAPRLRCPCGNVMILTKGAVT